MGVEQVIWLHSDIIVYHSLYPNFGCSLSKISDRDYPGRNYITEQIEVLDLDSYEASLPNSANDCTVDVVLGICNERQGKPCNTRHLLVELRMNYKSTRNLSPSEIRQKDVHSRNLLNACAEHTPIDQSLCLLFDNPIFYQAQRWLSRIQLEHSYACAWIIFSPSTFCNFVNAGKQFPYTPKPKTISIGNRFKNIADTQDLEVLDKEVQNICQYLSNCRQRFEKGECIYICQCINDSLPRLKTWKFDNVDDIDLYEIIMHDFDQHLRSIHNWIKNH